MGNKNSLNRSQKATPTTETMNKQLDESMIVSEACGDSQDQLSKNGFLIIQPFIVGWEVSVSHRNIMSDVDLCLFDLSDQGIMISNSLLIFRQIYLEDIGLAQIISVLQSIDEGVMCLMLVCCNRT